MGMRFGFMKKDYEVEIPMPVIACKRTRADQLTFKCPFCGHDHYHGNVEGYRASHCSSGIRETKMKVSEYYIYDVKNRFDKELIKSRVEAAGKMTRLYIFTKWQFPLIGVEET